MNQTLEETGLQLATVEAKAELVHVLLEIEIPQPVEGAGDPSLGVGNEGVHVRERLDPLGQCPHRMACARCDFYIPKGSGAAQLLEAKGNLLRLVQEIPLSDEERAAVDGDLEVVARLLDRLAHTPTPSGNVPGPPYRNLVPLETITLTKDAAAPVDST